MSPKTIQKSSRISKTLRNSLELLGSLRKLSKAHQKSPKTSKNIPNSLLNSPKLSLIAWRSPETLKNYPRISKKSLKLSENLQTSAKIIWLSQKIKFFSLSCNHAHIFLIFTQSHTHFQPKGHSRNHRHLWRATQWPFLRGLKMKVVLYTGKGGFFPVNSSNLSATWA